MNTLSLRKTKLHKVSLLTLMVACMTALLALVAGSSVAASGDTTRVSVSSTGNEGFAPSSEPSMSADGRYVAFRSLASNLVANDTNGFDDIFIRDRQTSTTERVSVSSAGIQAQGPSFAPSISADGRYIAFGSRANMDGAPISGIDVIYLRDRQTGLTERISVNSAGNPGLAPSFDPSISANDGRYVAFRSDAPNLVANDTNSVSDIFVRDRQTNSTERVSVSSAGSQAQAPSLDPSISADGRYVAFRSLANAFSNNTSDIFVRDRLTGTTEWISVSSTENDANGVSEQPSISADGRYVAFTSDASNLVANDTNNTSDVFVRDRQTGTTEKVSVNSAENEADQASGEPSISSDGRYVAFSSRASNLVANDTNGIADIFIRDRQTGTTQRVSIDSAGNEANAFSNQPSVSANGSHVAFSSGASNLVPNDTNSTPDVFVNETAINNVDTTPPDISYVLDPATPDGANGWYKSDVNLSWSVTDPESAASIVKSGCDDQSITSDQVETTYSCSATSDGGSTSAVNVSIKRDATPPSLLGFLTSPTPANGWFNFSPTVGWTCSDVTSGPAYCIKALRVDEGANQSFTETLADNAGNTTAYTVSNVNVDLTPPTVTVTGVSNGATYTLGSVPQAGCNTTDGLSGVLNNATLQPLSGGPLGSVTATCSGASDVAGNAGSASVTYNVVSDVVYNFSGFYQPVDNLPTLNKTKPGKTIPIRFSLGGDKGLNIFADGYPKSEAISCDSTAPVDGIEETVTAKQGLVYDPVSNRYTYDWATSSTWGGCRQFVMKLKDGSVQRANFIFR